MADAAILAQMGDANASQSAAQSATAAQLAKLQDQGDSYTRKIEMERRRSEELDKQIAAMEENIRAQRRKMGGVNAAQENHQQIQKQVVLLENRLEKALQKFNGALAHNTDLRADIDNLRRERAIMDDIYRKLEEELDSKRVEMASIIDAANEAYASRDAAEARMAQLKSEADMEQLAFEEEWKSLGALIEEDRKRKSEFLKRDKGEAGEEQSAADIQNESFDEESRLRKKVIAKNWGIAKQVAAQQVSQEKALAYNEAFKRIQQATGITEIDELVTTFIVANENNASAMTMVGLINDEIDKIAAQNAEMKGEIAKAMEASENAERNRKKILEDLDEKLDKTAQREKQYDLRFNAAVKFSSKIQTRVEEIFNQIGCADMLEAESLDRTEGCTDQNMMGYLSLVEQRITQIISEKIGGRRKKKLSATDAEAAAAADLSVMSLSQVEPLSIVPPSTGDEFFSEDEAEEEDGPLSRNELKDQSMRRVSRMAKAASPKGDD
eukprot:COSAG05_NODE_2096_length_3565_cov_3.277293_1_plen_497_part_00